MSETPQQPNENQAVAARPMPSPALTLAQEQTNPFDGPALTDAEIQEYETRAAHEGFLHRDLVAFDQFCNVLTGGLPDETISARCQRLADKGNKFGKFMSWWLGKIQAQHGQKAQAGDAARAERVEDTENSSLGQESS